MKTLLKIKDLYADLVTAQKNDALTTLLNQPPKKEWVKVHPFIKGYNYLPIERVEFLLKTIFKRYRIEITGQGQSFNGVWVTVRVHYIHPLTGEWDFHDGIGAAQLQTKSGTSPTDLQNINNGALSMAFPIAKTLAIKDGCDHLGKLFGSDLNRKDIINYEMDLTLIEFNEDHPNFAKAVLALENKTVTVTQIKEKYNINKETEKKFNNYENI